MSESEYTEFCEKQKKKGYDNHPTVSESGECKSDYDYAISGAHFLLKAKVSKEAAKEGA
jgi:hypothetical protein